MWRAAQVVAEGSKGGEVSGVLLRPVKLFKSLPQFSDALWFVRGAGSGAFKAGKHPPSSRHCAAHPWMTRPALATPLDCLMMSSTQGCRHQNSGVVLYVSA